MESYLKSLLVLDIFLASTDKQRGSNSTIELKLRDVSLTASFSHWILVMDVLPLSYVAASVEWERSSPALTIGIRACDQLMGKNILSLVWRACFQLVFAPSGIVSLCASLDGGSSPSRRCKILPASDAASVEWGICCSWPPIEIWACDKFTSKVVSLG